MLDAPIFTPKHLPPLDRRWTHDRVARLGFLAGLGLDARTIAADPLIASTATNVRRHAHRFGVLLRESQAARLPHPVARRLDAAATRRAMDRDALVHALLLAAGSADGLIDNILDDEA